MALVLGTNCGFVTVAPTADPAGANKVMDNVSWGLKDTSPATYTKIIEIGWWCDTASGEANFEVGLYSHDAVNDCPATQLYVDAVNAKGPDAGWKTVSVDWDITPETIYWIAVQLDDTATATYTNYAAVANSGSLGESPATQLKETWPSTDNRNEMYAFYALVGEAAEYVNISGSIEGTSSLSGTLTLYNIISISGTITGTSSLSGVITLSSNWQTSTFKNTKRLILAANDSIWYEDI